MMAGFLRHKHYASRQPTARPMSRMEHILREIWRFIRYIGFGFQEFFLLQQVYFASCSVGFAGDEEDPCEERVRRWPMEGRRYRTHDTARTLLGGFTLISKSEVPRDACSEKESSLGLGNATLFMTTAILLGH